jgi:acetoin utilization deacetylase AcuC-like enzyme
MRWVWSPQHRHHDPEVEFEESSLQPAFEHAGRAEAVYARLIADEAYDCVAARSFGVDVIQAVHDRGLVAFLERGWQQYQTFVRPAVHVVPDVFAPDDLWRGMGPGSEPVAVAAQAGWWAFETTTPLTVGTYDAARSAVDVALTATELVLAGDPVSYGLCRPPGHHATSRRYGGYCFFNNAAIAAHHVATTTGTRVTVLDVDVHHGNGTQEIFYERDDVQYVSLHGDPAVTYPFHVGFADETGAGRGRGANLNLPLPEGTGDEVYAHALRRALEAVDAFGPSLVVVSLGVDTAATDPIGRFALTPDAMGASGAAVASLGRPCVVLAEGGYDLDAIGDLTHRWLTGFLGD